MGELLQEDAWKNGHRNSKTLIKEAYLHVVLAALKAGARMDRHVTEGLVTIHTLQGRIRISVLGDAVDLPFGELLGLDAGVPHEVYAPEESVVLITLGWPR